MFLQINPYKLKIFLLTLQDFLMRKYTEKEKSKIGRKRIGPRWVIIALAIICRSENIAWREVPSMLSTCEFLINEGYLSKIPSWRKFYQEWTEVRLESIERFIIQLGTVTTENNSFEKFDVAVDSSGIAIYGVVFGDSSNVQIQGLKKHLNYLERFILQFHCPQGQ